MVYQGNIWQVLTRRKVLRPDNAENDSKLNRVLGLFDLTALGVGSTLGAGVYVLAGQIAKYQAGPSVMISFAIAAIASLLAGACYAEFGARVPKAGSAYVYSYVCIGEFAAFIIGWNLVLEYMVGTASVCRGISLYLDTLINDTLKTTFAEIAPLQIPFLGTYFDFFACGLVIVFGVALAFGVETSALANNFCTSLNLFILIFVIIAGSFKANFNNWTIDPVSVNVTNVDIGSGGYFPFGFEGTLKGAATCFFGFVGFDCIATTGEEVRNPRQNIPRSLMLSLLIIFLCYFGVSTVLTLMLPYYLQDGNAPLPYAFKSVGWPFAMWLVSIGGMVGLLASLFGALFPLPRILYSMAQDGLLFRFLGKISVRYRAPVIGSIFAASLTALMAGFFDMEQLVHLMSIGTLLAYSCVAISITILRYMDHATELEKQTRTNIELNEQTALNSNKERLTFKSTFLQILNIKRLQQPNAISTRIVGILITLFCFLSFGLGLLIMHTIPIFWKPENWTFKLFWILFGLSVLVLCIIILQPREAPINTFCVPFVPLVPAISVFLNVYLMLQLDVMTWMRFGIWMAIGLPMYLVTCNRKKFVKEQQLFTHQNFLHELHRSQDSNNNKEIIDNANQIQQNEQTIKSLDEIVCLNDISKDLVERKQANGKVFYIEESYSIDNSSSISIVSSNTLEEKTVIALLDDVLKQEEEQSSNTLQSPQQYLEVNERKISLDSEQLPSVIESTTVATVHSSNESLDCKQNEKYKESKFVAEQLLNEIFSSDRLRQALQQDFDEPMQQLSRATSLDSIASSVSIKDALHSEVFKNRLSQFLQQPPTNFKYRTSAQRDDILNFVPAPTLQQSRSEINVKKLVQKAIEGRHQFTTHNIPPAPRFDPLLYNTINSPKLYGKTRSDLNGILYDINTHKTNNLLMSKDENQNNILSKTEDIPFKLKLEAALQRGPNLHIQRNSQLYFISKK